MTKNGALISTNSTYTVTGPVVDRLTATSQFFLSDSNINLLGTFECSVTDGNGRTASELLQINGKNSN